MKVHRVRRVTIYRDHANRFRYRVQAGNWRVVDDPEQSFARKASCTKRIAERWPGVEVRDET